MAVESFENICAQLLWTSLY